MDIAPYLHFNGRCEEAFAFYAKVLGGTITYKQTFAESPMKDQVPPDWQGKVMHETLTVGKRILMGSDTPPSHFAAPQGFSVSLQTSSYDEAQRVFAALADGGQVRMPFSKTFWSPGFGMAVDRFGIPWMVNCEAAAV
jgi:PhnB protein